MTIFATGQSGHFFIHTFIHIHIHNKTLLPLHKFPPSNRPHNSMCTRVLVGMACVCSLKQISVLMHIFRKSYLLLLRLTVSSNNKAEILINCFEIACFLPHRAELNSSFAGRWLTTLEISIIGNCCLTFKEGRCICFKWRGVWGKSMHNRLGKGCLIKKKRIQWSTLNSSCICWLREWVKSSKALLQLALLTQINHRRGRISRHSIWKFNEKCANGVFVSGESPNDFGIYGAVE